VWRFQIFLDVGADRGYEGWRRIVRDSDVFGTASRNSERHLQEISF